jgi:hypothetical protein
VLYYTTPIGLQHICVAVTRFTAHLAEYGKMMTGNVGIPKCASAYILRFFLLCYQSFYGLLCSPDRPVIELIPVRILRLSSINCQASFVGISHTCTSTNKHHLKNSQKQQQKKRRFWGGNGEGGGCFKTVSRQLHKVTFYFLF